MQLAQSLFYDFITLLAIVDPIQSSAMFATLTAGMTREEQIRISRRAAIAAFVALVVFGFVGEWLLNVLGVSFGSFRVAGGLLLLLVGFNMVFAKTAAKQDRPPDGTTAVPADDIAIFPLAIPMIAGPGALTTIVTLVSKRRTSPVEDALVVVIAFVVIALTLLAMRVSGRLLKFFGTSGVSAVSRVMGIIVASISIQLIVNGLRQLFPILTH
jgi:multiple antibiotic resistance protein